MTMNTRENFWKMYCFASNQTWNETAKGNWQTATPWQVWISQDLTQNNKLLFSNTHIVLFSEPMYDQRTDMNNISQKSNLEWSWIKQTRIRHGYTVCLRANKWANHKWCWPVFVWGAVQKFVLAGCDRWFSIHIFFVAENHRQMRPTCAIVNLIILISN